MIPIIREAIKNSIYRNQYGYIQKEKMNSENLKEKYKGDLNI